MDERRMEPYSAKGHLTVQRHVNEGTMLVEVWVLERLIWAEDSTEAYDVVKCYVAHCNDVTSDGIPHSSNRVQDSCSWDEVPQEVRQEFKAQIRRIQASMERISKEEHE